MDKRLAYPSFSFIQKEQWQSWLRSATVSRLRITEKFIRSLYRKCEIQRNDLYGLS